MVSTPDRHTSARAERRYQRRHRGRPNRPPDAVARRHGWERIDVGSRWQPRSTSPAGRRVVNSRSKRCSSAKAAPAVRRTHHRRRGRSIPRRRPALTRPLMARGPVVVDTDVFSARLIANSLLARRNEPLLSGRGEIISFQPSPNSATAPSSAAGTSTSCPPQCSH